jgi:hypothetical protein
MTRETTVELTYVDDEALDRILARVYGILLGALDEEDSPPEAQAERNKRDVKHRQ